MVVTQNLLDGCTHRFISHHVALINSTYLKEIKKQQSNACKRTNGKQKYMIRVDVKVQVVSVPA
jgi:hypothetical protein